MCFGAKKIKRGDAKKAQVALTNLYKQKHVVDEELSDLRAKAAQAESNRQKFGESESNQHVSESFVREYGEAIAGTGAAPLPTSEKEIQTIWEKASRDRIKRGNRIRRVHRVHRYTRNILLAFIIVGALYFCIHVGYYLTHGLDIAQSVSAIRYDWSFWLQELENRASNPTPPTSAGSNASPQATGAAMADTPTPTKSPTSTLPTPTPTYTQTQIDQAINDYVNGRISRAQAITILGLQEVEKLDSIFKGSQ